MRLFHHHVGQAGAQRDFPKTVYTRVPLDRLVQIFEGHPSGPEVIRQLQVAFPSGSCNVWGAPAPAASVVRQMQTGDWVLLRESHVFVAAGQVRVFVPVEFHDASQALWGEPKFPWIFFFDAVPLDVLWSDFKAIVGYAPNYRTQGTFNSVSVENVKAAGGLERVLAQLRGFPLRPDHPLPAAPELRLLAVGDDFSALPEALRNDARDALNALLDIDLTLPPSEDERGIERSASSRLVRDAAFAALVKCVYGNRCAVCGLALRDLDGRAEVEAAHVKAVAAGGPDDVRSGIALCRTHHWAFDRGLFGLSDELTIVIQPTLTDVEGLRHFKGLAGRKLAKPAVENGSPFLPFVRWHRTQFRLD